MPSSIDVTAIETLQPVRNEYGPSDLSDSASDSVGTSAEFTDSDSNGTGDRPSVERPAPTQTENDIAPDISPDKIVPAVDGGEVEDGGEDDGGDDTFEDDELDVRDDESTDDVDTAD